MRRSQREDQATEIGLFVYNQYATFYIVCYLRGGRQFFDRSRVHLFGNFR